ncbi:arginine--tRNA ligase [Paenibacillus ginsengarvi]|uniref:Arginine--tRNA ligase n=1 Tax=Paenibacillus ginsengarvi TaxID=400777 RepID=A0A3B0CJU8_9BACL|nr:arginine--tRNA ligase [Paenibacillus ginsengarvi]RKN85101.1 arginine--tRNA ligase [Paenibacillus ginsengarvi]
MDYKSILAELVASAAEGLEASVIAAMIEVPPNPDMGDLSLPCFKLSRTMRKAPQQIAEELAGKLPPHPAFSRATAAAGYLNVFYDKRAFAESVLSEVLQAGDRYGSGTIGAGKTIVIDFSSPNIAKPFHVGHLRSTVIGNALYRIHKFLGFDCVGINHLGDWGTQFGKLITAYKLWGDEREVREGGIEELMRLYVLFHDEAEKKPELEDEARSWFVKLERGDEEALALWRWFKEISYEEFNRIYGLLGVTFDSDAGESFYNDKMGPVVEELKEKGLLEEDQGAYLVRLDEFNMAPALILKKDGATLYHTRDIAAALYRNRTYAFDKAIYVTDYAQNLHFQQWFKVIDLMGYEWADRLVHVAFGRVNLEGVKFSTRKGNVVLLEELLRQAIEKTRDIIENKNPSLDNKEEVARQVGVGAIIFNDLSNNRIKDVSFSWKDVLNFEGESGPYVQYTYARARSVLRKAGLADEQAAAAGFDAALLENAEAQQVLKELQSFPDKVRQAMDKLEPSIIGRHLIDIAQSFNRFYHECPILVDDAGLKTARLALVASVCSVLRTGLDLIGLQAPERI